MSPRALASSTRNRCVGPTPWGPRPAAMTPGKKVQGRKRHIVTDTLGLLLVVMVTAASVQDRDGGAEIFKRVHKLVPSLRHVFADGGYAGKLVAKAKRYWKISVEVVSKPAGQRGFAVLPRRWVVERTFAWLVRWRRLVRDYERFPETHEAFVKWARARDRVHRDPRRRDPSTHRNQLAPPWR